MDELPPEEEACVLWRHAARSRVGKEKEGGGRATGKGGEKKKKKVYRQLAGRCSFFDSADPLRPVYRSNHPPSLVVVSAWQALAGWPEAVRLAAGRDMTVLTDRCASRPLFCRHGWWVTISQNSDLDCCLLLPSDPPSQPLPLRYFRCSTAQLREYGRYSSR